MSPSLPYCVQLGEAASFTVARRRGQIDFSALVMVPCLSKATNKYRSPRTQWMGCFPPLIERLPFVLRKSHIKGPSHDVLQPQGNSHWERRSCSLISENSHHALHSSIHGNLLRVTCSINDRWMSRCPVVVERTWALESDRLRVELYLQMFL